VIPGATNSILSFTNLTLANAGLYTVICSNSSGTKQATAYLSVCVTPGTNQLVYAYTNHVLVGQALTMTSLITNAPGATNSYKWQFNYGDITTFSTNGNTFSLTPGQAAVNKSGIYSVVFRSVVTTNTIVNDQVYDSYWAFGALPSVTASPQPTNVAVGGNATFNASAVTAATPYGNGTPMWCLWFRNGAELVATQQLTGTNVTASLTISNVTAANTGTYSAVMSNFWGSATSAGAALTLPAAASPTNLSFSFSAGSLQLSWPDTHLGWILQSQTNPPGAGLSLSSGNWHDWPSTGTVTSTNVPVGQAAGSVFFRLRQP
jgi:hypothetical protein